MTRPKKEKYLSASTYEGKPPAKEAQVYKGKDPNEERVQSFSEKKKKKETRDKIYNTNSGCNSDSIE